MNKFCSSNPILSAQGLPVRYQFVKLLFLISEPCQKFASNPELEVVLITANGKRTEKLLGIITTFDIVRLE